MEYSLDVQEKLDRYLRGELMGKELKNFEADLKMNPALKEFINQQQNVVEGLRHYKETQFFTGIHSELLEEQANLRGRGKPIFSRSLAILAIAILVVILLIVIYLIAN